MPGEFTPHTTPLGAQTLDALVVAAGYAQTTYAPTTSGSSLTFTQPACTVVVPTATGTALSVSVASQTVTVVASMDIYIDVTSTAALTQSAVTAGSAAPAVAATSTRLYRVTANATGVTTLFLLAPVNIPLTIDQIKADEADYAVTDTAGWQHTLRYSLAAFRSSLAAVASSLASYIPLSQRGMANGVVTLDASQRAVGPGGAILGGPATITTMTTGGTTSFSISTASVTNAVVIDSLGSVTFNGNVYTMSRLIGGGGAAGGVPALDSGKHIVPSSGTPTLSAPIAGAAALQAGATDQAGRIQINSGPSPGTGLFCQLIFAAPLDSSRVPAVVLVMETNPNACRYTAGNPTAGGFGVYCDITPPANVIINLAYIVL